MELSLLAVNDRLVRLAERLLGDDGLRIYAAEAWEKFSGVADYQQLEMFVYLVDVPEGLGAAMRTHAGPLHHAP